MRKTNKKFAFTMAEILISLAVIGVVAAITIPSLTGKTTAKQFAATYKKAFASIDQALKIAGTDSKDASADRVSDDAPLALGQALIDNLGARRLNNSWALKYPTNSIWALNETKKSLIIGTSQPASADNTTSEVYVLKDGLAHLIVRIPTNGKCYGAGKPIRVNNTVDFTGSYCLGYIDVNGNKGPNQVITCDNQTTVMPNNATFLLNIDGNGCTIASDSVTDIFPVVIYDDKIIPATPAAATVLRDNIDR